MQKTIQELNEITKKTFGNDMSVSLARCPAFGNSDCCVIFLGAAHKIAAALFATKAPGSSVKSSVSEFMGELSGSTTVEWPA